MSQEKIEFQAEVKQLLHLLIHSLYTNKEVFVRELVSNASDALDKLRYEELSGKKVVDQGKPLEIHFDLDEANKTITISDNGLGMTRQELIDNIGTLGRSGSAEYIKKITEEAKKDSNIIGEFGVGFYSSFMAGKEVSVVTKSFQPDEPAVEWRSDGTGSFTLVESDRKERGSSIKISLNDDSVEFAQKERVEGVIKKYSNFVSYPIFIAGKRINEVTAVWARSKSELKPEDYSGFYRFLTNTGEDPRFHIHYSVDAPIHIQALLYVPAKNMELMGFGKTEGSLNLYSKKILIQGDCKDLLPDYLRFLKGVVDSDDLPLNISRETIQENILFQKIKTNVVKKFFGHVEKLAEKNKIEYEKFWKEFGRNIKEGIHTDWDNRKKLSHLLRFNSSVCENAEELISLKEYVSRMGKEQKEIYYICGPNRESIELSPHLEIFKSKKMEVLYMLDPVDEYFLSALTEYEDKQLKSIDQADLDFLKDVKDTEQEGEKESVVEISRFEKLVDRFKKTLGPKVLDVKKSNRLTDSPCCIVNAGGAGSANIQKLMKMMNQDFQSTPKTLELNSRNALVKNLGSICESEKNPELVDQCCVQLFDNALIMDDMMNNPRETVGRMNSIMEQTTDLLLDKFGGKSVIITP